MIASLQENVNGAIVIGRANFVATVRAWRSNQVALQQAIQARMGVSQAETNAFLKAEIKVTDYLRRFMNGSGWFHDAPIPEDVRADVDGPLKHLYGALAEDLKDRLNAWEVAHAPPEANLFFDTLRAFSAGMQEVEDGAQRGAEVMRTFVHAATRVSIGFVPFVGPAMDLCEAVTGREWCTPTGRQLTTGERVFSGIGFGVGKLVKVWKGVAKAAISSEGKAAAAVIYTMSSELIEKIGKARIQNWKTLTRGSILPKTVEKLENDWEVTTFLALIDKQDHKVLAMGEGTRNVLGMVPDAKGNWPKSADLLTVSPNGGLIITEAKFPRGPTRGPGVDCYGAVEQLKSSTEHAVKKGEAQGVELVQLAIPKNAELTVKSVIDEVSGVVTEFHYAIDNGYLLENGKRIPLPGKPDFFVKVLELEKP